jgi:hypothetical protein
VKLPWLLALSVLAVTAAACGGGGGGSALAPSSSGSGGSGSGSGSGSGGGGSTSLPAGFLSASVKITVPSASSGPSSVRRTKLVEPNTQSITFTLLQTTGSSTGSTPQTFTLTTANPNCATSASGLACTLSVAAPVGTDVFLAQTYSGTSGSGTLTGSGAVKLSVAVNASNTASISLDGTVSSVYLVTSASYLGLPPSDNNNNNDDAHARVASAARRSTLSASGLISSFQVIPIALDSNNDPILNPSTYDAPIVLQLLYINEYTSDTDTTSAPDVTLNVSYNASVDPGGCGGNASTSALFGTVTVCSPSDTITATISNVAGGAQAASILAGFGSNPVYFTGIPASPTPMPLPDATPAGFNYVQFFVTPNAFSVTDENGNPISATNPVTFLATGSGAAQYIYVTDIGYTGSLTFGGNCGPYVSDSIYNYQSGYYYIELTPNSVTSGVPNGICTATVSDGTNTYSVPISVTTTGFTGS